MFKVSDIITTPPAAFSSELQRRVYETFAEKGIPFERVDTDPGITTDDKPFVTRDFCGALGIPRVSFASAEKLWERTDVEVGATTILSAVLPLAQGVHLVMDRGVAQADWFACTDGTTTCFMKIRTRDLLDKYLVAFSRWLTP